MTKRFATCLATMIGLCAASALPAEATQYFYRQIDPQAGSATPGSTSSDSPPPSPGPVGSGSDSSPPPTPGVGTNAPPSSTMAVSTPGSARARVGIAFALPIQLTGANGTVSWYDIGDALPAGLTLGQDGTISGTPTTAARADAVQIMAVDSTGQTARTASFAIDVRPLPSVSYAPPASVQAGSQSTILPSVNDAYGTQAWALVSGSLPSGMSLDAASGAVSGAATATGTYDGIAVAVTDQDGATGKSNTFSIVVSPAPTLAYPSVTLDKGPTYVVVPQATGLTPPITYALVSRSGPANCSGPDGQGALTCSQTSGDGAVATYVVSATDSANKAASSAPVSITDGAVAGFSVGPARTVLRARTGSAFSGAVSVTNAAGPVTLRALDPLPSGFSLNAASGAITASDVPAAAVGSTDVRISGSFTSGGVTQTATATYAIAVSQPLAISSPTASGSPAQGVPYSASGTVSNVAGGGTPAMSSTGLPSGLTVAANGSTYTISGTPRNSGTFQATVTATDPSDGTTASTPVSLTVAPATATASPPAPSLVEGDAASVTFSTSLPNPTWTWTGAPAWLSLSQSGGTLSASGTSPGVTQATSYSVAATATGGGSTASATSTISVSPSVATYTNPGPVRSGSAASIPVSTSMNAPGSWAVTAWSGGGPLAVSDPSSHATSVTGAYPANATSGPVTQTFTATFTASGTPTSGQAARSVVSPSVTVYPALALGAVADATFTAGSAFAASPPALTGAYGVTTWQIWSGSQNVTSTLGQAIPGLSFDAATGRISGTPTGGGSAQLSYRVHDDGRNVSAMAQDAASGSFTLSGSAATASVSPAQSTLNPGDALGATVTTSIDSPNWSVTGSQPWIAATPNGKTLALSGTAPALAQAADYAPTATASNAASSTATPVQIHVNPVTASLSPVVTRTGRAFSTALTTNYPNGAWAMQPTSPSDVTFSGYASGSFAGTAPSNPGRTAITRTMTASLPGGGGVAASATLTVQPDLSVGAQADQSFIAGNGVSLAAPQGYGAIGGLTWRLYIDGGAEVTANLGGTCPGLSFAPATGAISGIPQSPCNVSLRYVAADDAGGASALQETAISPKFALQVANGQVTLAANPAAPITEGDAVTVTATTNLSNPVYSVAGAPAWMQFQTRQSDGAYVASGSSGDVSADTTYSITVTATSGSLNASSTVGVTVKAAIPSVASTVVRSGGTFSMALSDTMAAPATWTAAASQPDVTNLSATSSAVTGKAPANGGTSAITRTVTATHTANNAPASGPAASSSATGTLTVQPNLNLASLGAQGGNVGSPVSIQPPAVTGQVGALTYTLYQGSTDVSGSLGAANGPCPGLSFSKATGAITGTPSTACSANLAHRVSDDGNGNPALAAASTSATSFALTIGNATVTATTTPATPTVTEGDSVAVSATTSLPSPTWSVSGNPAWMTFTQTGSTFSANSVSGDVSTATTYAVVLTATSGTASAQQTVSVTVNPSTVAFTAGPTPVRSGGAVSATVTKSMNASGSWSATSNPADVTLLAISNGSLTGKAPTNAGTAAITRSLTATYTGPAVSGGSPASASASASLSVYPALSIAAPSNQSGQAGVAVSFAAPAVTGQAGGLTYALLQGANDVSATLGAANGACPGLSFSTATGAISGTPSGACSATLSYKVSDDGQPSPSTLQASASSAAFTLSVGAATSTATNSTVSVIEGSATTFSATTSLPSATWTASGNPAWMTFTQSGSTYGTNSVSAHVTSPQSYTVILTATNASGASTSSTFNVTVSPATAGVANVSARSGASFNTTLTTSMVAAGSWTASASPADVTGLAVSGLTLSGTAPANGGASALTRTLTATIQATTAPSSGAAATATGTGTLTVQPALTIASLANQTGTVGSSVSVAAPAVGGAVGNLTYSLYQGSNDVSSTLGAANGACPGLSFSSTTGAISGTPSTTCSASLSHRVRDNAGGDPNLVATASSASAFTLSVTGATATATTTPSPATVTEGDTVAVSATTTLPSPTWSVSGNPAWMAFTQSGGTYAANAVSGDVSSTTPYAVVLTATSGTYTAQQTVNVTVNPSSVSFTQAPTPVRSGGAFTATATKTMAAAGAWSVSASPSDVTGLSVSGGAISGTAPANAGTSTISRTITATYTGPAVSGGSPAMASSSAALTVYPALTVAAPANQTGQAGVAVSFGPPAVNGRAGGLTYALYQGTTNISSNPGSACAGLTFSTANGTVGGTPSGACSATLSYKVADDGQPSPSTLQASASSATFTLTVGAATSSASNSTVPVVEGSPATFSVTTSLPSPTFTVTGNPNWMTFTQSGGTYATNSVSPHVTSAQPYSVVVSATNASGASTSSTVSVTVSPATVSVGSTTVRSGSAFSVSLQSSMASGTWTGSAPADVTGVSASGPASGGTLSGTAPANGGTSSTTRTLTATITAPTAPSTGAIAAESGTGTLTVLPPLSMQSQSAQTASVGSPVSIAAPAVTGLAGTASYALYNGSTDISDTIGAANGTCPGLSFSRTTGAIQGTPSTACSPSLTYKVSDNGGGNLNLAATATTPSAFTLTVGAATATATTTPSPATVTEGDTVAVSATTSLPSPTWSASGKPAWMTFTQSGGTYTASATSPDVTSATTSSIVLTATSGTYSAQQTVSVTVNPATVSFTSAPAAVRAGAGFSAPVTKTMNAAGTWSASTTQGDVTFSGVSNGTLSGTAPASVSANPSTRTITLSYTASAAPTVGSAATASTTSTLTVYQNLAFAAAPSNQSGAVGTAITAFAPPGVNGKVGALTYALYQGSTNVSSTFGATIAAGGICPGLQFSTTTGQISGTPSAACTPTLTYKVSDDGGGASNLATNNVASATFQLNVTNSIPAQFSFAPASNVAGGSTNDGVATLSGMTAPGNLSVSAGGTGYTVALGINGATPSTTIPATVPANATLDVQIVAPAGTNGGSRSATVTVSGVSATYTVTTIDTTPDPFSWPNQTGVGLGGGAQSTAVTITGLTSAANLTVAGQGPTYVSVNGGAQTMGPTTVSNGQTVQIFTTGSKNPNSSVQVTVTIGGVSGTFTAYAVRNIPTNMNCAESRNSVYPGTGGQEYYCTIYLSGMDIQAAWTASGAYNRVYTDAAGWSTASSGTVAANAKIVLAVLAPAGSNGGTNAGTLQVSSAQQTLTVRTGDTTPDAFGWSSAQNQPLSTNVSSGYINITGIDQPTPVSASNGSVSINGASWATSGTIYPGQTLAALVTSAGTYNASNQVTVNVGGVSGSFIAYTGDYPCDGTGNSATNQNEYFFYNSDVQNAGWVAMRHWIRFGVFEGRKSCFQTPACNAYGDGGNNPQNGNMYYYFNPDVQQAGIDPYTHWTNYGINEGRIGCYPRPDSR